MENSKYKDYIYKNYFNPKRGSYNNKITNNKYDSLTPTGYSSHSSNITNIKNNKSDSTTHDEGPPLELIYHKMEKKIETLNLVQIKIKNPFSKLMKKIR